MPFCGCRACALVFNLFGNIFLHQSMAIYFSGQRQKHRLIGSATAAADMLCCLRWFDIAK